MALVRVGSEAEASNARDYLRSFAGYALRQRLWLPRAAHPYRTLHNAGQSITEAKILGFAFGGRGNGPVDHRHSAGRPGGRCDMAIDATKLRRGVRKLGNRQRTQIQSCPHPQPSTLIRPGLPPLLWQVPASWQPDQ